MELSDLSVGPLVVCESQADRDAHNSVARILAKEVHSLYEVAGVSCEPMKKHMFCPKCGGDGQSAESYCKRCGEWLPDLDAIHRPGLFRTRTREEKIRKMRLLEAVSAGLSLTAGVLITSVLVADADVQLLFLAAICCVIVAVYQIINFYLGYKIHHRVDRSRSDVPDELKGAQPAIGRLNAADTTPFVNRASVVENTTELLERVPHQTHRKEPQRGTKGAKSI